MYSYTEYKAKGSGVKVFLNLQNIMLLLFLSTYFDNF